MRLCQGASAPGNEDSAFGVHLADLPLWLTSLRRNFREPCSPCFPETSGPCPGSAPPSVPCSSFILRSTLPAPLALVFTVLRMMLFPRHPCVPRPQRTSHQPSTCPTQSRDPSPAPGPHPAYQGWEHKTRLLFSLAPGNIKSMWCATLVPSGPRRGHSTEQGGVNGSQSSKPGRLPSHSDPLSSSLFFSFFLFIFYLLLHFPSSAD